MATIGRNPSWKCARNAVLVHAPENDNASCLAHVRVSHDQTHGRGFITIKIKLRLAGLEDQSQTIHLNILPKAIDSCSVVRASYNNILPAELVSKLRGVDRASAVTTMILQLNTPGVVLVSTRMTMNSIRPVDPSDDDFHAISQISRATNIRLHFRKQDIQNDWLEFQAFTSALDKHTLDLPQPNYTHLNGGEGAQERHWSIFDQQTRPPSYTPRPVLGKRSRGEDSGSEPALRLLCTPPPYSPTEVNTSIEANTPTQVDGSGRVNTNHEFKTRVTDKLLDAVSFSNGNSPCNALPSSDIRLPTTPTDKEQKTQEISPSTIVPTVFHRGRSQSTPIIKYQKSQEKETSYSQSEHGHADDGVRAIKAAMSSTTTESYVRTIVHEIAQKVVDTDKHDILFDHQHLWDEAEMQISEAVDDGKYTLDTKTEECCEVIDEHCEKLQEACAESCEFLQADAAALEDCSTRMNEARGKLLYALKCVVLAADRVKPQPCHPSARAAQIIQHDFESLDTATKVAMLTKVADEGFANVFVAVNHELRKELLTAWSKSRT